MRIYLSEGRKSRISPLNIRFFLGRVRLPKRNSLMRLVRDIGGALLPSVITGGTLLCFQSTASTNLAGNADLARSGQLIFLLVLVTSFFCDSACSAALGFFTDRLIEPFWHRFRERHPTSVTSSAGRSRSLKQWLCSPGRNEKNSRPCHSTRVSHNRAPPQIPPLSTYSYI